MLPDFPKVKQRVNMLLTRHMRAEVNRRSAILSQIRRTRQHEGEHWGLEGADGHEDGGGYKRVEAAFELTRDEMKSETIQAVMTRMGEVAEHFAKAQTRDLISKVSEAAEGVGNVVSAGGSFGKEHFLEMVRRVQTDFDPVTNEPRHPSLVLHPDTWEKIKDDVMTWEEDPDFLEAVQAIEDEQRRAWRDRESRRRLVD